LLAALRRSPDPPEELARALSLDPTATDRILALLTLCDALDPSPDMLADASRVAASLEGMERLVWAQLPRFLQTGETLFESMGRAQAYSRVTPHLGEMFAADAARLALEVEIPAGARILDVGAGSGVWSLAMARPHADVRVTAVDFEVVLPRFRERASALGLGHRVDTISGSYFEAALPGQGFDCAIVANVLHLESPARAQELLLRIAPALRPSGTWVICGCFSRGGLEEERERAAYALHLAMRVRGGYPHRQDDVARWLGAGGARNPRLIEIPGGHVVRSAMVAQAR
jgi:ubiquinone/menaquinone biosynthesis C-methylase UbiE